METNIAHNYRQVRVSFRKQVSDGNYGTEAAEVSLEWYMDGGDGEDDENMAHELLNNARALVHAQLSRSPSTRVRQSLTAPKQTQTLDDAYEAAL